MNFVPTKTASETLAAYAKLFSASFRVTHLNQQYLTWLYARNPAGEVIGFDAFEGEQLAAHYVCVPTEIELYGDPQRALLSLNTATHPQFQGRGLFTKLANMTYERGAAEGYSCVYGIANTNSTPGFVRKLGFQLVTRLEARVGMGSLGAGWKAVREKACFRRIWNRPLLEWRIANPSNPLKAKRSRHDTLSLTARTGIALMKAYGEIPLESDFTSTVSFSVPSARLFLGLFPAGTCRFKGFIMVPERLKPSPLNLIFKGLTHSGQELDPKSILFSFIDFDAY